MNAPARPRPMSASRAITVKAWIGNAPVIDCPALDEAQDAQQAIAAVAPRSHHKAVVSVLFENAVTREMTLSLYRIRKSTVKGRWRDALDGGRPVFEGKLEPDLLATIPMTAFAPKPPFDAFRDDPVGAPRDIVEVGRG